MTQSRRVATVTQISNYIKVLFDQVPVLQNVWIKGEISNFKHHSSGHLYMTLKDGGAVLKAVMFKNAALSLSFKPEDGMMVLARGRIGVYESGGQYQLYVEEMEADGQGDLYAQFEKLKKMLGEEGLFDESRKKPIPKYPEKIGIITSPTGAAVRDMINVLRRRCPMVKAILYPCLVQGEGASKNIKEALEYFNKEKNVDVIILGRGGGSIEDLWAFNEELTARAIAASDIPVISGVGHETDFTISDFVSDLRAPTPSAAAEIAVPDIVELRKMIDISGVRMNALLKQRIENQKKNFNLLCQRSSLTNFSRRLLDLSQTLDRNFDSLSRAFSNKKELSVKRLEALTGKLSALNPLAIFERGYSSTIKNGKMLTSVKQVNTGDDITLRMADGELECSVTNITLL